MKTIFFTTMMLLSMVFGYGQKRQIKMPKVNDKASAEKIFNKSEFSVENLTQKKKDTLRRDSIINANDKKGNILLRKKKNSNF